MDPPAKASRAWTLEEEVNAYLLDTTDNHDIVQFWEVRMHPGPYGTMQKKIDEPLIQDHQLTWPMIFLLAIDILPIQGSSVPCERIFSSSKETMTAWRNCISSTLMEALQILKFAI
jgi:hypothetical protein